MYIVCEWQVSAPRYSLVGEKVPVTLEISTDCPLEESMLLLSTGATESICEPNFCNAGQDAGSVVKELTVRALRTGENWTSQTFLLAKGPGQVICMGFTA